MCRPSQGRAHHTDELTLGNLFRTAGKDFSRIHRLTPNQAKVISRIASCRTKVLGGHLWGCESCGGVVPLYNSCRNRHCPLCQRMDQFRWVSARVSELLPVPYFHCVFTLPHILNPLVAANPKALLGALFMAASVTLQKFAKDPKFLGAKVGVLMVLHTWGQKLNLHYHVHCVVTGGGLNDNQEWVPSSSEKFLFPVKAMSPVFRGIYMEELGRLLSQNALRIPDPYRSYFDNHSQLKRRLFSKPWVVYAKRPFSGPFTVLKYLARYTHRVAIANSRIIQYENGLVTFTYKDYRNENATEKLKLPLEKFLNRFVSHILPDGFKKIRNYGIWANPCKKKLIPFCQKLLGIPKIPKDFVTSLHESEQPHDQDTDVRTCPFCGHRTLRVTQSIPAHKSTPPPYYDSS